MKKRQLLMQLAALAVCIALGAAMMVIGRGHTVYLDNKTLEDYQGQTYKAAHKIVVTVDGKELTKLGPRERGMSPCIGQSFEMSLEITQEKGGEPETKVIQLDLPYSIDGIIVNLPALLAGLPEEAWMSEFIPAPEPEEPDEETPGEGDEFDIGGDLGLDDGLDMGGEM